MSSPLAIYSSKELSSIIKGYRLLDRAGYLSSLLKKVVGCKNCASEYPNRTDKPINCLVRPLPLGRLAKEEQVTKYSIRIKRDDTFLRNLFQTNTKTRSVVDGIKSAKFAIGINPWLDRCMLYRKSKKTKLMVIGIDYSHFQVFHKQTRDHNFPLDSYRKQNNIWRRTWKRFWENLLGRPYDETTVNEFLGENGVFITNSMLCFGGVDKSEYHFSGFLECCRNHLRELLRIVRPEIIVSFGNLGCRNVAALLLDRNNENPVLDTLSTALAPLRKMESIITHREHRQGIKVRYNSRDMIFWPLYQPARSHINWYNGDYETLKKLVG